MSGVRLPVVIDDADVMAALAALRAGGQLQGAWRNIGEALVQSTEDRWRTATAPDGQPWAPLAPATLRAKRANREARSPEAILVLRGHLRGSIRYQLAADGVEIGTDRPYAAAHQLGATIRQGGRSQTVHYSVRSKAEGKLPPGTWRFRKKRDAKKKGVQSRTVEIGGRTIRIPARPFLGISTADQAEILTILTDHITDMVPDAR